MVRSDNQDNLSLVNFLPTKCPTKLSERQKIYIRRDLYTFFFVHFLLLVCTSLEFKREKLFVRANDQDPFLLNFSPSSPAKSEKTKIVAIIRGCLDQ